MRLMGACLFRFLILVFMFFAVHISTYAGGTLRVTITSGSMTSITPTRIDLTSNGVPWGGQNPINPPWSIPAGGYTDSRTYEVIIDPTTINDFHMQYDASGYPHQIDIDPLTLGQTYPLSREDGYVRVTALGGGNAAPALSDWAIGLLILSVLFLGVYEIIKRRRINVSRL